MVRPNSRIEQIDKNLDKIEELKGVIYNFKFKKNLDNNIYTTKDIERFINKIAHLFF